MGSKEALKVRKDEGAAKLFKDAVKKRSDRDRFSMSRRITFHYTQIRRW